MYIIWWYDCHPLLYDPTTLTCTYMYHVDMAHVPLFDIVTELAEPGRAVCKGQAWHADYML